MSSSSIQKVSEPGSIVPERERIKKMIFDLEKDEVEKLGDILAEETYVKPKHLLDLSLDDSGDKKKKKPKAGVQKTDRKLKPSTGPHSLIDIENHRPAGVARIARNTDGFLAEDDPLADLQASTQSSESMTLDSIMKEALETQADRKAVSSPKSPEELLREALEKSNLDLDPAITSKLTGTAETAETIEAAEAEPQPDAGAVTLSDEELALLDELEIDAEESAQLFDLDMGTPLERPQLNGGEDLELFDTDAQSEETSLVDDFELTESEETSLADDFELTESEETSLADDFEFTQPKANMAGKSDMWKRALDSSAYLDEQQSAREFTGAKDLVASGDILEALNRFRHICLMSSYSHYTLLAYLELKKRDQDTQELIDQMIEKEKELLLLLETAKGENNE